ncbi:MMPL family transporter [Nocardia salmonicida]|uniref:MMPL family transporter n=1 Tax=Nocardia salmonicida TaxID=53431 RepID=UPI0007C863EA|nr:MMPL family transporter [Nocardia salmonicida]
MLSTVARFATGSPRAVIAAALLIMMACGAFGASVQSHLKFGGFLTTDAESAQASRFLDENFPGGNPNLVVLVHADGGVDSEAARAAGRRVLDALSRHKEVVGVQSYWTPVSPAFTASMRSQDGKSALILGNIPGDESAAQIAGGKLEEELNGTDDNGVSVHAGGLPVSFSDIYNQTMHDTIRAEAIAIPVSLVLLVLVFGSLIAASLPLAIGLFAMAASLGILRALTLFTDISIYAMNMVSMLGLALAIDYSLLIVSRYREELARGLETRAAVVRSIQTAGRTVVFSALTVAFSLAALAVFEQYFLRSFAYAGVAVVIAAAAAAIVILPACLILLGERVNSLDLRVWLRRRMGRVAGDPVPPEHSRWYRVVTAVMKRAAPVAIVVTAILLLLGAPFLGARFGYPDDRTLPAQASARVVGDALREDFDARLASGSVIAVPGYQGNQHDIGAYATGLSRTVGVVAVTSSDGIYVNGGKVFAAPPGMTGPAGTFLSVRTNVDAYSAAGEDQLAALRAVPPPATVQFGGNTAINHDSMTSMGDRLPLAVAVILLTSLVLLFLFTGSVVLPLKALLLNMLSLTATFGAMVWIFQDGHLADILGFTPTGSLNPAMPILMFCLAFGMSMDYEVFLLSRIREEWLASDRTPTANTHAVAMGIAKTGRIYTAAAGLMALVIGATATSKVSFMIMFGIGLSLAVIIDAVVIRTALGPALMRLMSTSNWWAPKPLARLHQRIGLDEAPSHTSSTTAVKPGGSVATPATR